MLIIIVLNKNKLNTKFLDMITKLFFVASAMLCLQGNAQTNKKQKKSIVKVGAGVSDIVKSAKDFIPGNNVLVYDDFAQSVFAIFLLTGRQTPAAK